MKTIAQHKILSFFLSIFIMFSFTACSSTHNIGKCPDFKTYQSTSVKTNKKKTSKHKKYKKQKQNQKEVIVYNKTEDIRSLNPKTQKAIQSTDSKTSLVIALPSQISRNTLVIEDQTDKTFKAKEQVSLENSSVGKQSNPKVPQLVETKTLSDRQNKVVPVSKKALKKQFKQQAKAGGKSQFAALILVIFFGLLGVHRFYLGYAGIGIIQLLTVGFFGIWTFIDFLLILFGGLGPKNGKYE